MTLKKCEQCGKETEDLKPWGENNAMICVNCGLSSSNLPLTLQNIFKEIFLKKVGEDGKQQNDNSN